jgi:3-phenylpropionate/cinnamic acid dioxygenase small subunit
MSKLKLGMLILVSMLLAMSWAQMGEAKRDTPDATAKATERAQYTHVGDPDRSEILDLICRYSHTVDAQDLEGFLSLFIEDCRWVAHLPKEPIVLDSRDKLRAHLATRLQYFADNGIQTRHLQTNTLLTRIDEIHVQGVTYLMLLGQLKEESGPMLISTGVYQDEFVKTEQGWKFAVREATIDQGRLPKVEKGSGNR